MGYWLLAGHVVCLPLRQDKVYLQSVKVYLQSEMVYISSSALHFSKALLTYKKKECPHHFSSIITLIIPIGKCYFVRVLHVI